ncbi:MAG: HIT domain-containing protein [candidate division WOR-3 bacterium]|nr:HIT domain-containing protein [candidate division WOR-3 bacterium]MCX7947189.1 HIT domain-containing protein [candidate division WOR-3 bacterium]MDW8150245.1 HIT domain-containing protein [candidate division WOR-3 bacterium]
MNGCVFCKIIKGEIKSEIVFEDRDTIAIKDINPQAPVHILVIPKLHIPTIVDIDEKTSTSIFNAIKEVSKILNLNSFRVVNNFGPDALQTIYHVHFHILAGRKFSWPPG